MSVQARHTRCPQCKTRFRVTDAQLAIAKGKVRCGQCQSVFNALDHLLDDPSPAPPREQTPPPPEPIAPVTQAPASEPEPKPEEEEEFLFEDNPEEDATERNYTGRPDRLEEEFSSSFLALDEEASWHDAMDEDLLEKPVDESWADNLLEEGDESLPPSPPTSAQPGSQDDEDWNQLVDWESLDGPGVKQPQQPPEDNIADLAPAAAAAQGNARQPSAQMPEMAAETGLDWQELQAEPIAASPVRNSNRFRWWWRGLALLLVAILLAQLIWVQRDALSANAWLRPVYVQACSLMGCELPPQVDRSQIVSRDLVVRSHPDSPGALLVEARIHNRANFTQPLPAIALSFSNLNGDIVAQRVFRPAEYLATEQPVTEIGANRALPIKLSLQDPGREAINYRMDFLALPQ